jgi:hypothetical protein
MSARGCTPPRSQRTVTVTVFDGELTLPAWSKATTYQLNVPRTFFADYAAPVVVANIAPLR